MNIESKKFVIFGKLLVAAIAILALVAMPAKLFMPSASLAQLFLYCAVGVVCIMVVLSFVAVCSLQVSQFILRLGATDTQWFWFSSEPKGLVALRQQHRDSKSVGDGRP